MYVIPKSEVIIGDIKLYGVDSGINSVKINTSVNSLSGTAKLTIARNFAKRDDKGILDYIQVGQKCTIKLGYNDKLNVDFIGYVTKIGDGTPLVIDLEDAAYIFKKADKVTKNWQSTTLKEVLRFLFVDYEIDAFDMSFDKGFPINNETPYEVINRLKETYNFSTRIDAENKKISCFWAYKFGGFKTHTYVFGTRNNEYISAIHSLGLAMNVAKNDLKFQRKEDVKLAITAIARQSNGKNIKIEIGSNDSDASKRTLNFGSEITTEAQLKQRATEELERLTYDGYTGSVTGFGLPFTAAGDCLKLVDYEQKEREGKYLIEAVEINYGVSTGLRRVNTLSYKM